MRWRLWSWLTGLLALAIGALLLRGCSTDGAVATLDRAHGSVERDHAGAVGQFGPAAVGSRFRVGDAIQTAHAAGAELTLDDGSRLLLDQDTRLRFLAAPPATGARGLDVETGRATLETGRTPFQLYTSVGLALLEPGASVAIEHGPSGLRFSVRVGLARFETRDGPRSLQAGSALSIDIGGAVLEASRQPEPVERESPELPPGADVSALIEGLGAQVRAPNVTAWRPLPPGPAAIAQGSSLQLAPGSRATFTSADGSVALRGKGEFVIAAPGRPFIQTTLGRIEVERGRTPLSLAVPGGSITVRPWSKADAAVDAETTALAVSAGSAALLGPFGQDTLWAGERATISGSGRLEVTGRGPAQADMLAGAGSSFVVHDPSPPTSVGFQLKPLCPKGGIVERLAMLGSRVLASSRGDDSANLLVASGTHRYQVRCVTEDGIQHHASATGVVTIVRDSGTGALSRVPPVTRIDADGRSYTVTYQSLLPQIVARWPRAPQATSYSVTLDSRRGTTTHAASSPTFTFKAGELAEGTYTLKFSADGQLSALTKLAIAFDNAAPTARIQSPQNRSFQLGSSVNVAGVAVPGWDVSVDGGPLVTDSQGRFSAQVTVSPAQQALQLRFAHPRRGVHYYLRHAAGTIP